MLRLSASVLLAAFLASPNPMAAHGEAAKAQTIYLFGARWCAPCMAEYRELPNLVRAASPEHIILAWIDRSIAPPVGLASDVGAISADEARNVADEIAGVGYGLPFSAIFDADGHVCAIWRHPLAPADFEHLRLLCRRILKAP